MGKKKKSNKTKKNLKKQNKANNTDNNVDSVVASLENASISALDVQPENRQQLSDPYPFVFSSSNEPPVFGRGSGRPPIEQGRTARVVGLVNRSDLNGTRVTIKRILDNGRVECEVIHLESTDYETRESIVIRPQNLEVHYIVTGSREWGQEIEECPICLDTKMDTTTNASIMECCGGKICKKCFAETQKTEQKDVCPLCRSDTSDTSEAASVKKVRKRANRGDANAMYNLGGYYDSGLFGVIQNQALARIWYQRAAEKGEARGAHNLGCSFRDGEGGPIDKVAAAKYFRMAAELGHVESSTNLGLALMRGDGVEVNMDEAKKWLTKGAQAGDELAVQQLEMCNMLEQTKGTPGMSFSFVPGANVFSFSR